MAAVVRRLEPGLAATDAAATAVAFVLIVVLVAVGMLAGPKALGAGNSSWSSTSTKVTNAMSERSP